MPKKHHFNYTRNYKVNHSLVYILLSRKNTITLKIYLYIYIYIQVIIHLNQSVATI